MTPKKTFSSIGRSEMIEAIYLMINEECGGNNPFDCDETEKAYKALIEDMQDNEYIDLITDLRNAHDKNAFAVGFMTALKLYTDL